MINTFPKPFVNNKKKKIPFFLSFLICGIVFFILNKNLIYISFLPLLLFFVIRNNLKANIEMLIIISIFLFCLFVFGKYCLFNRFSIWLEQLLKFSFRNKIFLFTKQKYGNDIGWFINLIVFNHKNVEAILFYRKTIKLGIAWIICVSGFHLQLIRRIILFFIPRKNKAIGDIICNIFLVFYAYMINFSYSSMRVIFQLIFSRFFRKNKINKIESLVY